MAPRRGRPARSDRPARRRTRVIPEGDANLDQTTALLADPAAMAAIRQANAEAEAGDVIYGPQFPRHFRVMRG